MSLERRRRLVNLAAEHGFMIIEDNVYGDLRYDGDPLPTLFSLDEAGSVIKIDSFSKTLIPALRMAWVTGHSAAISTIDRVRRDLGVSQLTARVLGRFLAEGNFDTHIANACELYRSKRDVALAGLEEYCTPWVTTNRPDGGYFLWMRLSDDVDASALQGKAFAEGVMCRPGERFFGADVLDGEYLRLAFTTPTVADLQRAVEVLGKAASDSVR
jgi:2-aminoadipate transaminase